MKRTACIITSVVALLAWVSGPVAAQDSPDLVMQVWVGYDGYCRSDSWCPVYIVLSNEGADIEGELVMPVEASSGGGSGPDVYARRIVLPSHSRKAYFLYSPPAGLSTRSRLTVRLRSGGQELASHETPVTWLGEDERLYGIVSSDPSALGFLANVVPLGGRAMVAYLDLEALPPDPLAWEGLDVLILNDVDTTALDAERRRALETWVAHGGHLIVGGGAGAARTVVGVADLLPVTTDGTRSVESLQALAEHARAPSTAGPYAVAETALRDGKALITQGDLILLARCAYGAGQVDFLAFDAGLNPFASWDDAVTLWEWIVGAEIGGIQPVARNGYSAREAVNALPGRTLPSTLHILGFLVVYTLLIGPANYIVLRKLDRRELAWLTIPLLIVGFSACAYVTGFQIRGLQAVVHRLALVYVPEEARFGRVCQLVGLFSPRRTNYDVWVPGAEVRGIPGDYYYGGAAPGPLHVLAEAEGVTVADLRVDVGGIEPFIVEGYTEVSAIETDLRLVEGAGGNLWLEGTVRNGGLPLKDALVIVGYNEQRLGDLEAGEEVSIRVSSHSGGLPSAYGVGLSDRILGTSSGYWNDPDMYRRYLFLQAFFDPYASPYSGTSVGGSQVLQAGAYLMGWTEDAPLPVEVAGRPHSTVDMTFYVYALPLTESETGTSRTIPSGLIEREVVETVGQVESWPEGFYMGPWSEITFRFSWSQAAVGQVDELVLELSKADPYDSMAGLPAVSLWNRETDEWDPLGIRWGQNPISNVGPYVTSSSSVLLHLESGSEGVELTGLSISVKGKQ